MARLAAAMQIQQMRPMRMGLAPDFTSFTRSVFSPMAAMAMTMKNRLKVFKGAKTATSAPAATATVVMTEAAKKSRMKVGRARFSEKPLNDYFAAAYADGSMMECAETYGVQAAIIEQ